MRDDDRRDVTAALGTMTAYALQRHRSGDSQSEIDRHEAFVQHMLLWALRSTPSAWRAFLRAAGFDVDDDADLAHITEERTLSGRTPEQKRWGRPDLEIEFSQGGTTRVLRIELKTAADLQESQLHHYRDAPPQTARAEVAVVAIVPSWRTDLPRLKEMEQDRVRVRTWSELASHLASRTATDIATTLLATACESAETVGFASLPLPGTCSSLFGETRQEFVTALSTFHRLAPTAAFSLDKRNGETWLQEGLAAGAGRWGFQFDANDMTNGTPLTVLDYSGEYISITVESAASADDRSLDMVNDAVRHAPPGGDALRENIRHHVTTMSTSTITARQRALEDAGSILWQAIFMATRTMRENGVTFPNPQPKPPVIDGLPRYAITGTLDDRMVEVALDLTLWQRADTPIVITVTNRFGESAPEKVKLTREMRGRDYVNKIAATVEKLLA